MIRFGICDDCPITCSAVEKLIHTYMKSENHDFETFIFSDSKQLLSFRERIDVLFLDIDLPEIDGFQAAELLNLKTDETIILFLTSYTKDFQKAFKVRAFRYLLKPISVAEFNEAIRDSLNELQTFKKKIIIRDNGREILVSESKIMYIESIGDKTAVHIDSYGTIISGWILKEWLKNLDEAKFIRSHRTFIVNFDYVKALETGTISLVSGVSIPVATRSARSVRERMREYIRKK